MRSLGFTVTISGSASMSVCRICSLMKRLYPVRRDFPARAFDVTTYRPGIILDSGIFISELSRINEEMRNFREQSPIKGMELMRNPQVVTLCTEKVKLIVYKVAAGMHMPAGDVEVTFGEKQPQQRRVRAGPNVETRCLASLQRLYCMKFQ